MAAFAVHETDTVDAQLGVERHRDAEGTAPFVEVHRGQVKRHIRLHARALIGIAENPPVFVGDLVLPIVGVKPRQGKVEGTGGLKRFGQGDG